MMNNEKKEGFYRYYVEIHYMLQLMGCRDVFG
jgi:hypothetical protein